MARSICATVQCKVKRGVLGQRRAAGSAVQPSSEFCLTQVSRCEKNNTPSGHNVRPSKLSFLGCRHKEREGGVSCCVLRRTRQQWNCTRGHFLRAGETRFVARGPPKSATPLADALVSFDLTWQKSERYTAPFGPGRAADVKHVTTLRGRSTLRRYVVTWLAPAR